jgi:hypothetical protein
MNGILIDSSPLERGEKGEGEDIIRGTRSSILDHLQKSWSDPKASGGQGLKLPAASCRESSTVRKGAIFRFAR